ncbi:hypothetical protein GCM10010232_48890 [Streptomyces amakusaensis]|uniref:Uncharacterized protein n=1 Tax=Streptomyces amakusaensis TaxID=67271 RepID=A0ABW0AK42_9ACTN
MSDTREPASRPGRPPASFAHAALTAAGALTLGTLHLIAATALLTAVLAEPGTAPDSHLATRQTVTLHVLVTVGTEAFAVTLTAALAAGMRMPRWWLGGPALLIIAAVAVQLLHAP